MAVSILLDVREHALIQLLPTAPTQQLPVGDVWIGNMDVSGLSPAIVAERKSVADLEASLLDGRYREQRTRLLAFCAEKGARALYIIEGELDRLGGRMTKDALQKILNRLMLRYKVPVLQTINTEDTANAITLLQKQLEEDSTVFQGETLSYSDVTSFTKKGNKDDPKQFALAALQQCPGVSVGIARAILEGCGTLEEVFKAHESQIAAFKNGARKVGPAVAKRLFALLHS
jgi:ERCC4-type nuclease